MNFLNSIGGGVVDRFASVGGSTTWGIKWASAFSGY